MKQILVALTPGLAKELERVAPARSRKRSDFIRRAIQKALWELEEQRTAEAYARHPDLAEDHYVDAGEWEPPAPPRRRRPRR